jgi:hypothetical protein
MDEKQFATILAQAKTEYLELFNSPDMKASMPNPTDRIEAMRTICYRADNIEKANHREESAEKAKTEPASEKQTNYIKDLMAKKNVKLQDLLDEYEIKELKQLTKEQAYGAITRLKEKK